MNIVSVGVGVCVTNILRQKKYQGPCDVIIKTNAWKGIM